jgi:hypothetical protein
MLSRLVESVGLGPALAFAAFFDGVRTAYIPEHYRSGHILERVLGEVAFLRLIADFGGETVMVPRPHFDAERRLGAVYRGMRDSLTTKQIAEQIGISYRRVRQIEVAIKAGGTLTTAARNA